MAMRYTQTRANAARAGPYPLQQHIAPDDALVCTEILSPSSTSPSPPPLERQFSIRAPVIIVPESPPNSPTAPSGTVRIVAYESTTDDDDNGDDDDDNESQPYSH